MVELDRIHVFINFEKTSLMKTLLPLLILTILFSCSVKEDQVDLTERIQNTRGLMVVKPEIDKSLKSKKLKGSVLVYDEKQDRFYSNDYAWAKQGQLPASTFKIVNSIIAIETGVVDDENTLFEWNGEKRMLATWEKDLIFKEAFHESCVPCYQEVARDIGVDRMKSYLKKLDYGAMDVSKENIDLFWLMGESKVNQFQQIHLLRELDDSKLPISKRTEKIVKKMIIREENDDYVLSGKTGLSITDDVWNGWFVGYVKSDGNTFFFATNVEPENPSGDMELKDFTKSRIELTYELLDDVGVHIQR